MNFKKKIAAIATAAACSLSIVGFSGKNVDDLNVYAASVTGKSAFEITNDMTIGWNLGNSLDCSGTGASYGTEPKYSVTKWGNPEPTQELIDSVKAAGFNTVRVPTTWYEHIRKDSNGFWEIDPQWMAYVKKNVDFAYNNGMYVILNLHHEDWVNVSRFTDETKANASEKIEDIWSQISEEFKDYDQRLIFEGMNEPRQTYDSSVEWGGGDTNSWQYINDLNAIFVDAVRGQGSSENKERLLMLPGYCASSGVNTVRSINVPAGSGNVALSVHAYLPYFFAMATDNMANHEYKADGSSASGYGSNYKQEINEFFNNMKSVMNEKNVPIIIGEFSASDFGNTESRQNWAKDYLTAAENANIPCVLWDNNAVYTEGAAESGENHGYVNRKTNKWYSQSAPVIETMMKTVGVTNYSIPVYTPVTDFSWDNVKVGSDWIELFKSVNGQVTLDDEGNPGDWANIDIPNFNDYINENYKLVMFAKSASDPTIVLMTSNLGKVDGQGWNYIMNDGTSTQDFVYNFSYADMKGTVESTGDNMDNVTNLFAAAHGSPVTVYGLYAVPVNSQPESTEPTEATTETETTASETETTASETETTVESTTVTTAPQPTEATTTATPVQPSKVGDVNCDGSVSLTDAVLLACHLSNKEVYPLKDEIAYANADVDYDNQLTSSDLDMLNEYNLKTITHF